MLQLKMDFNERQKSIIVFAKKNKNFQTKNIVDFLFGKFSVKRITIIRDLTLLVSNGILMQEGRGRSINYSLTKDYWVFETIDVEDYFNTPYEKREIQEKFNFGIFKIFENDIFTKTEEKKLNDLHKEFVKNISTYDSKTLINKEYERIMIEFSWKSSAIEGNTYSLLNTEALIKQNIKDTTKTESETQMILNHKDAFNESIQNKNSFSNIKISDLSYIHSVLMKKLNITPNIRKHAVGITGSKYMPLDNEFQIKEALENLIGLINKKDSFFEKAFLALILLSYIQAFEDGNKRTARMFSNAILLSNNSIPLSYRIVDIVEYKKASILFYELNNISYFKKIFIEQYQDSVKNYFR